MTPDGEPGWEDAARRCAARLREDRGVSDSWSVTNDSGGLWVTYDGIRVQVGAGADITSEQGLFEEIDSWVAHERPAGPGRWLPRDAAAVREADHAARRCVAWFQAAATRLAADLENAWGVSTVWQVTESQVDPSWPGEERLPAMPLDNEVREGIWGELVEVGAVVTGQPPPTPVTGRVSWPEIRILMTAADGSGAGLTAPYWELTGEDDAVDELAVLFEDALMEEVWGYWPTCPAHDHALAITRVDGVATWWCSEAGQDLAAVGSLTRDPHAPVLN